MIVTKLNLDPRLSLNNTPKSINIIGVFDGSLLARFTDEFNEASNKQDIVVVAINSMGGDSGVAIAICDLIYSSKIPVATIALGEAQSAAAMVLTSGTHGYRYVSENSTVMIHTGSWKTEGKTNHMLAQSEHGCQVSDRLFTMLDRNCQQKPGFFKRQILSRANNDWYFSAKEAKKYGLVDHIKVPHFEINARLEMKLV